jgi:hypothetical protein
VNMEDRDVDMHLVVPRIDFQSTQELKDLIVKSRSKIFSPSQYVVVEFSGTLDIKELAFYEVCFAHQSTYVA